MSNKRVSELAPITSPELDFADLLLLSDLSAQESKKLSLSDLSNFLLLDGRLTGSLLGTASYALFSGTASYALNAITPTSVLTASYLLYQTGFMNGTASMAMQALSSSYSLSSSYAITASYALTSSVQLVYSSAFADFARTASYLLFTPGSTNGTASYSQTASFWLGYTPQVSCSYASASTLAYTAVSSSEALIANQAITASNSLTTSFLTFQGVPNGTASFALVAANIVNNRIDYGIYQAITQSVSSSQLDLISVIPTFGGLKRTEIEAYGTLRVPYTTSVDGRVELWVVNRQTGISESLDSSPITIQTGGTAQISGTLRYPITLAGQTSMYGLYEAYVTASSGVYVGSQRNFRFSIASESDQLGVNQAEPMQFITNASNAILLWSSSLHPGVAYQGSCSQVTFSGSLDVIELLVPPSSVNSMQYTWTLMGCQKITANNNAGLTTLGGIPSACVSMSAANCSLVDLPPLISSSISYLHVPNNSIVTTLTTPASMSYINVANNFYVTLPTNLPQGLAVLVADGLNMTTTPSTSPNTLISMSFANCPSLTTWAPASFPSLLAYLSTDSSPLANIPSAVPSPLLFVDVGNCQLTATAISILAQGLVTNGLSNGRFNFVNNPSSASATNIITNITTLRSRGWTITS